VKPLQVCRN